MNIVEGLASSPITGTHVPAVTLQCDDCGSFAFQICFLSEQDQPHLQCAQCQSSYCQNGCCTVDPRDLSEEG